VKGARQATAEYLPARTPAPRTRLCTNTVGSRTCGACNEGYAENNAGVCVDIDECTTLEQACDSLTDCVNSDGSYDCSDCPAGTRGDPKVGCEDINECLSKACDEVTNCTNLFGTYRCSACPAGYFGAGAGATDCQDINECLVASGGCEVPLRDCINTEGSYSCSPCDEGYEESGPHQCDDIDECEEELDDCETNEVCVNATPGWTCEDLDECEEDLDLCVETGEVCVNEDPDYRCDDIDECEAETDTCTSTQQCVNADPGFSCVECGMDLSGCGTVCTDLETDEDNCGVCGMACDDEILCAGGNCQTGTGD
jgi:latent transforming growth factor beta binding protein